MADEFNSYFVQSVEELSKDFQSVDSLNHSLRVTSIDSFYIKEVPDTKVAEIINKLSNSKSNDIFRMNILHCSGASCQVYADDAVLYEPAKSPEQAAAVLSTSMSDIQQWLIQNQLLLNLSKTVSMCFYIKKLDLKERFNINLQNKDIHPVTEFKYLGLVLDPQEENLKNNTK